MKKKYTQTQIDRALSQVDKGKTYEEAAEAANINVHTLKYYANKLKKQTLTNSANPPRTLVRRKKETGTRDLTKELAMAVSGQVMRELRSIFAH